MQTCLHFMNQHFDNTARLYDVVIIRSLAIIMVVAFHAYYMMMVSGHFPESAQSYHDMYFCINNLILQFRMPLFIFISGYLFSHLENDRGKYATFKMLITNKFKRLIIPFFVFTTIFMLSINDFSWDPYYRWGYQHLWFIPMLFWCFIFTRLLSFLSFSKKLWWKCVLLIVFFCLNIMPVELDRWFGLSNFIKWYFWFYFGYQLYLNRNMLYDIINRHKTIISIILATAFCAGCWVKCSLFEDNSTLTWYTEAANASIVILIWYWTNKLLFSGLMGGVVMTRLEWLNRHSYGIYVFHNWLQPFMISSTATALFGLDVLAQKHIIIFPAVFFISSFLLSLGLTWLLLKTRVGRFLIG